MKPYKYQNISLFSLQLLFQGLNIGLSIDLKDQIHQWRNAMRAALSRAVPLFTGKMRYQGRPSGTNRSRSWLEETKRNASQQTELCTASSSRKQRALLPCFTPWNAEHRYPACKNPGDLSAGREMLPLTQKENIKSFSFLPQLGVLAVFPSHLKIWLIFVFHFLLKSWQQTTCFGRTFASKDMIDTQSIHISKRHCTCGHQAGFRCFRRYTICVIHLVSSVKLCH